MENSDRQKPALVRANVVDEEGNIVESKAVRADEIKLPTSPRHESLPPELRERAVNTWGRVGKLCRPNLNEAKWIDGFRFDTNPEHELAVWEKIADITDEFWDHPMSRNLLRQTLAQAVMMVSIGSVDIPSQLPGITDEMVTLIRERWTRE